MSDEDPNVDRAASADRPDQPPPADRPDRAVVMGMTPEQAMQMLSVETGKRRRVATSLQSGSRLVSIGLVSGVLALLLPPSVERLSWLLGALAVLSGGFGALRLLAAWQLGRR